MRYLDPKNDLTFKKVFGQHPHLLRSFLNALLPLDEGQVIESLEYLPAELVPVVPLFKHTIVDVRCRDNHGRQFIVEMQMLWTDSFKSRVLFNASKAYVSQLGRGRQYEGLQPVYALSLVDQIFEPASSEFYHHYRFVHSTEPERRLEGLELIFVELPKFRPDNLLAKRMQVLWMRYLTEIRDQTEQIPPELLAQPELEEAVEYLRESAFTRDELAGYDRYWDSISSERTLLAAAIREGQAQGKAEGLAEGLARGKREGLLEQARRMKARGFDAAAISEITGLSDAEIQTL
ncbi:Rpn family recombination-promoting nuclease/putative transposase [Hymenobacter caeli]